MLGVFKACVAERLQLVQLLGTAGKTCMCAGQQFVKAAVIGAGKYTKALLVVASARC